MRITRRMVVGIVAIILGITAFAYQGLAMQTMAEGQRSLWALPPIVGTAMLLAAGIVLIAAEVRTMWMKEQSTRRQ
jgi:uncharacterized membrane protein SirB2